MANQSLMLEQMIAARRRPEVAAAMLHAMQAARMVRVNKARATRNFFIRIGSVAVTALNPDKTFSVRSPALSNDYIIVAISGGTAGSLGNATVSLRVRFDARLRPDLSNENIPGQVLIGGGDNVNLGMVQQEQPVDLPLPIAVEANEQIVFDFIVAGPFATTVTPELTLHCIRVLPADHAEAQLPGQWMREVESQIKSYPPRMVYLRTIVDYGNIPPDGRFKTDFVKVPMFLLGATSDLVASRLALRDELAGYDFMQAVASAAANDSNVAVPSWVIAPNAHSRLGGTYWFQRPHLLLPGTQLSVLATDGLDIDQPINEAMFSAVPNKIGWICQTV